MSTSQNQNSYPTNLIMQHILPDGTSIIIRPIRHDDAEIIREFSRHLSSELKHLNYMENFKELPEKMEQD
jgi:acetyltransferase